MPSNGEPTAGRADQALNEREISALASAGLWYANYHARSVAGMAGDESAYATARRERYEDLLSGLGKLGATAWVPAGCRLGGGTEHRTQ